MAREIVWRDLLTLFRFRNQELFLDNTLGLTYAPGPFSSVLLSLLLPTSGFCTAVEAQSEGSPPLFGQVYSSNTNTTAHCTFLAPADGVSPPSLVRLLSFLSQQVGEKGGFQVLAEVKQDPTLEDGFREAGFQPYAEQHVWMVPGSFSSASHTSSWVPISRQDKLKIEGFYRQVVPRSVQRVEPPPSTKDHQGLACWNGDDLLGFTSFHWGPRGVLVDLVVDPGVSDLEGHLLTILEMLSPNPPQKSYFRVRTYQKKLASALGRVGAKQGLPQLAMVKYLAIHYRSKKSYQLTAFDKQPDITTPFMNSKSK